MSCENCMRKLANARIANDLLVKESVTQAAAIKEWSEAYLKERAEVERLRADRDYWYKRYAETARKLPAGLPVDEETERRNRLDRGITEVRAALKGEGNG